MTPQEYKEKSNDFAAQYNNAMRRLNQEYALSNSPYQAGGYDYRWECYAYN